MEKTLLGISASPRKLGNCELLLKEIFRQLGSGWQLKLARLPQLEIKPCRACYQCLFDKMRCPQADDFLTVLEALAEADAFVVAAPAYMLSANGSLKKFLDRGLQFYAYADQLWGKPAAGVAIAGIEGMEGAAKLNVDSFIKLTMADLRGTAVIYGALPGETLLSKENRQVAFMLAKALLNPADRLAPEGPVCSLCGGDSFRILAEGRAKCLLCSEEGRYEWLDGSLGFEMAPGSHPLFLTREDVTRHAQWLRSMKEKFLERRKELKEVTKDYLGVGKWIGEDK